MIERVTYTALQRTTVDIVAIELADCHGGVLMRIHLDECETPVGLKTSFENVTKVLEQRDQVVLAGVRGQVTDIAGSLPLRGLRSDHVVALDALSGEVVVAEWSGRGHSHGGHGLLLGDRGLALLVGPVAANGTRTKPLAIHRVKSLVSIATIAEGDKAVTARATCLHVPHHTSL